ncbi:MAG: FAD synthetase family protein [Treponema sp.]|jgi:riboflavin kinase/FMN adenylyltransferase|nr:FAD synthetase family protein [Treponema sp.]
MEILNWDDFIANEERKSFAAVIGVLDGVHRGHQALIKRIVNREEKSTVITFRQNPKRALSCQDGQDITSLEEKLDIFEKMGVMRVILIDFSENFSRIEGRTFIETLLDRGLSFLAIGENFRCGRQRDIGAKDIRRVAAERGVETDIVRPVLLDGRRISSSMIREAIIQGDFALASIALGREFMAAQKKQLSLVVAMNCSMW